MQPYCRRNRWTALLLALCLVAFFCLSGTYFVAHVHHACTGRHCPVCERVSILLALAASFTAAAALLRVWALGAPCTACVPKAASRFWRVGTTPVGRFDRMND